MAKKGTGKWAKIEAEYRAGATLAELQRKHKVSYKELIKRIREGGWKRDSEPEPEPATAQKVLPAPADAQPEDSNDPTARQVVSRHKRLLETLREQCGRELAEIQAMSRLVPSFLDSQQIEQLWRAGEASGDYSQYFKYLQQGLGARKIVAELIEKHAKTVNQLVLTERKVYGLESAEGPEDEAQSWDDLLEEIKEPVPARALPQGVIDFEAKQRQVAGG